MAKPNMEPVIAICPGSYDPVTYGHLDLVERAARVFDRLIVAVLQNVQKEPLFPVDERVEMLKEATHGMENVEIDVFHGLLVDFARQKNARVIVRGIRAVSDYEYELQMALMNRKMEPRLETVFMLPAETFSYLSSSLVKEIARLGGSVEGLVPPQVAKRLAERAR